jgi:hypothetical protein
MVDVSDNNEPHQQVENQKFFYVCKTDYKAISFTCQANGLWKIDLLKFCDLKCRTIA